MLKCLFIKVQHKNKVTVLYYYHHYYYNNLGHLSLVQLPREVKGRH